MFTVTFPVTSVTFSVTSVSFSQDDRSRDIEHLKKENLRRGCSVYIFENVDFDILEVFAKQKSHEYKYMV